MMNIRNFTRTLIATGLLTLGLAVQATDLPGKGVKVLPLQSSLAEETFQTLLVTRALQKLGYEVLPIE
jgi:glycine betaine/proline transport system substrate-binding protein